MSVCYLMKETAADAVGPETMLRVIGTREPPARMVVQIAIKGTAGVQIEGRIARDAPWQEMGPKHESSALMHINAVPFLRAVASHVGPSTTVSVWAVWAW